ncbi:endonuclease and methylase LlaGI [Treponema primitia ZAS-2]|uniref:Endonuclease and methylase LlaGI n=1 Tax=Treponema primitia (strain ATCC BAA-887 / DSM 12427 / ZAS-2) TaxID=545694 RepID=F5YJV7_TREPZ|nr:type ISP restriction/modification enzyme [Treponema primitia]AEF85129.1 endonuclease and methylase LlaGI [Treponema primitia ZAS-2]
MNPFETVIQKYRDTAFSERDKGYRFEKLMQEYLKSDPLYAAQWSNVWLWGDFPSRNDFSGKDTGIDLVARTIHGDYWAIQCKCFKEDTRINKPMVDTFLSTSGKSFYDVLEPGKKVRFSCRLWLDTTIAGFNPEAENVIKGQSPEVKRRGYYDLVDAPVDWAKLDKGSSGEQAVKKRYSPKPHQQTAIDATHNYLKTSDRGKLIMACGTGKTFTSLRIAENETGGKGFVLFLVPSIALLGQTLREWSAQAQEPIYPICICSDAQVSKTKDDDSVVDLALPASTSIKNITQQYDRAIASQKKSGGLVVVFSTYQSIDVISQVQKSINKQKQGSFLFDLIICDEAHRTTGVTISGQDESAFVKVHDDKFLKSKKRIYMTATPRLYSESAQKKAKEADALLCSMDDTKLYGEEMYRIGFGEAVDKELLSDYKVIVLTIETEQLNEKLKASIEKHNTNENKEIEVEEALKIIGCINALSKKSLTDKEIFENIDPQPMHSAVAFCQNIAISKATAEAFNDVREAYFESLTEEQRKEIVTVESDHVDGTMGAQTRERKLQWLKSADTGKQDCHILNNVRCLSEGVDVPSLDAVMFLSARNSQIDVVQSVGRVMRKAPNKKYGYIIIPVVVPSTAEPEKILASDRFNVVWTVLNALRAHDDRFNATINKIELNKKKPDKIKVTGTSIGGAAVDGDDDSGSGATKDRKLKSEFQKQMELEFAQFQGYIYAKMVQKCGNRLYWEQWAADVANIAERHIEQITAIVSQPGKPKDEFTRYLSGLQKNINPSVSQKDAIEMLAQHIITQPVFEALFEDYSFVKNNPVSQSMQGIINVLNEKTTKEDSEQLDRFYVSVRKRAEGLDNGEAKQRVISDLYDKFFRTAFPLVTEKLGIVYTPVEIVDFIIHSVEDVLQKEFSRSLSDENVHILDPFTGTGTFITRLLQSGIIRPEDLERKYNKEIHANEIMLLAYYIASINIENVYHDLLKSIDPYNEAFLEPIKELAVADSGAKAKIKKFPKKAANQGYTAFNGICLTDTFQLGETKEGEDLFSEIFPQNSRRVQEQQKTPLRVIIGNPPYSVGQKSANDNAQNQHYPKLEARIANTYAANSNATNKNSLYDSYIKAFRWSTDRLKVQDGGVIAFITNSGWIEKGGGLDGMRKCLEDEFSSIYIFNLRGAIKGRSGELAKREGQNVFNILTGVAITILVKKKSDINTKATIYYRDIGEYINRKEKLDILNKEKTILDRIAESEILKPNIQSDWILQRGNLFSTYIPLEPFKKLDAASKSFFVLYSNGVSTNRDPWSYNSSKEILIKNMRSHVRFYNQQVDEYKTALQNNSSLSIDDFKNNSTDKIKWSSSLENNLKNLKKAKFDVNNIVISTYRTFFQQYLYYGDKMVHRPGQFDQFCPNIDTKYYIICVPAIGNRGDFSTIMTNNITDLHISSDGTQCFPLYWYEKKNKVQGGLFENVEDEYIRHDAISDFILEQAKTRYGNRVTKEDIFYYVYGILHSLEYRKIFANDLKKMLPRLPLAKKPHDFWEFSKAGKKLADLHLAYEDQKKPTEVKVTGTEKRDFIVNKMEFAKKDKKEQKDTIIYNAHITISNIPAKAYEYVVNGKSAIEWIMERYAVTTHKESGITNNPNDWAAEHGDPRYILDLLLSVITVSVNTIDIVNGLPTVEFQI